MTDSFERRKNILRTAIWEPIENEVANSQIDLLRVSTWNQSFSFEGWLKIKLLKVFSNQIQSVRNKETDIKFVDPLMGSLELKASSDNIGKSYFYDSTNFPYNDPVLFIAGAAPINTIEKMQEKYPLDFIGHRTLCNNKLIFGLAIRRPERFE